jgi:hypothetical protein
LAVRIPTAALPQSPICTRKSTSSAAALPPSTPAIPLNRAPLSNGPAGASCIFPAALAASGPRSGPAARPLQSALPRLLPTILLWPPAALRAALRSALPAPAVCTPPPLRRLRPSPNPANPFARPDWPAKGPAVWLAALSKRTVALPNPTPTPVKPCSGTRRPHVPPEMGKPATTVASRTVVTFILSP